ncbi:hypothetical protein [Micromonospora sp. NPDC126480]|uniref:hypothetical protein n=1 Tax=Micromonospora sp. NPDC126480 TaxID=3155312 RepID=UPI0033235245
MDREAFNELRREASREADAQKRELATEIINERRREAGRAADAEKVRENRLRRMAQRQGLTLVKSRRRDPRATDYGMYWLADTHTSALETPEQGMTLDEIEAYLKG